MMGRSVLPPPHLLAKAGRSIGESLDNMYLDKEGRMQDELTRIAVDTLKQLAQQSHNPAEVRLQAAIHLLELSKVDLDKGADHG